MKLSRFFFTAFAAVALMSCSGNASQADNADDAAADKAQTERADDIAGEAADSLADKGSVIELEADDNLVPETSPIVIDFSATWCGPCQQFKPVYHKVADEYASKAVFTSADVDVCKDLAEKYNVTSIPCITIVYPASTGREAVSTVGYMDEAQFKAFLDENL